MTTSQTSKMAERPGPSSEEAFAASTGQCEAIRTFLAGEVAAALEHAELEHYIRTEGFELLRLFLQDHFDLRAIREVRLGEVTDAAGDAHGAVEPRHQRPLGTIVGTVTVTRVAYRRRGTNNLYPADGALNLPLELYSHGLRELGAIEASRGSFEEGQDAVERTTTVKVPKRQLEALAGAAAVDFDDFYGTEARPEANPGEVVVVSTDGKGIVMRPDGLRPGHRRRRGQDRPQAQRASLPRREGEPQAHGYRRRRLHRGPRTPHTSRHHGPRRRRGTNKPAPKAAHKWLKASVDKDAARVIAEVFDEAERRDPKHRRPWVALVDGNNHQLDRIRAEAKARKIRRLTIVVDFVHVLQYIWAAAWCFFAEGDPAAEDWVHDKAAAVLEGKATIVAAAIRRKATTLGLDDKQRTNADAGADYLLSKAPYLDYSTALAKGWPIATGVIEGACRHIVKDRLGLTGSRWSVNGAEAILKLRALRANDDWSSYWSFHQAQERKRVHEARYLDGVIPRAA